MKRETKVVTAKKQVKPRTTRRKPTPDILGQPNTTAMDFTIDFAPGLPHDDNGKHYVPAKLRVTRLSRVRGILASMRQASDG